MTNELNEVQKLLKEEDIPEFINNVPSELYSKAVKDKLNILSEKAIAEISNDNSLIEFLCDLRIPKEANLDLIEKLLKNQKAVTGDFFKEETVIKTNEDSGTGFQKASGKISSITKDIPQDKNECNVEEYIIERISKEILESKINITWEDIV